MPQIEQPVFPLQIFLRIAAIIACLVGTGLIAWTTATGPHHAKRHLWDFNSVPYLFVAYSLSIIWNTSNLLFIYVLAYLIHPGIELGIDLFLAVGATFDGVVGLIEASSTATWDASHWYDDSAHDSYRAVHHNGTRYWVPARNYTPCSGFVNCEEQDVYTAKTHHRGIVELVGCVFAFLAGAIHFVLFILACIKVHKYMKDKRERRARELAQETLVSSTKNPYNGSAKQNSLAMLSQLISGSTVYVQTVGSHQTYRMLPRYG